MCGMHRRDGHRRHTGTTQRHRGIYIYGRFSIEYIHIEERHRKYIVGNIYHLDERIAI